MKRIYYRKGYKYQLSQDYYVMVDIYPEQLIKTEFITLSPNGYMVIKKGYAWDGPSGPTIDTRDFMRGSLIHDALYQLIRQKHLHSEVRELADEELRRACLEDGMCKLRANYVFRAVRKHGEPSASPSNVKKIYVAPKTSEKIDNELSPS